MIDLRTIFEIHRMANEGSSVRKIAENLQLSRKTVKKYLKDPNPKKPVIKRANKLDPFKDEIKRLLEIDHSVSAVVIQQRIAELGFDGEITIMPVYSISKLKQVMDIPTVPLPKDQLAYRVSLGFLLRPPKKVNRRIYRYGSLPAPDHHPNPATRT